MFLEFGIELLCWMLVIDYCDLVFREYIRPFYFYFSRLFYLSLNYIIWARPPVDFIWIVGIFESCDGIVGIILFSIEHCLLPFLEHFIISVYFNLVSAESYHHSQNCVAAKLLNCKSQKKHYLFHSKQYQNIIIPATAPYKWLN